MSSDQPTSAEIRAFVLAFLDEQVRAAGLEPGDLSDDADLLGDGIIDSFTVLDLMATVGDHYGIGESWETYAAEDILVLDVFLAFVERHAAPASQSG